MANPLLRALEGFKRLCTYNPVPTGVSKSSFFLSFLYFFFHFFQLIFSLSLFIFLEHTVFQKYTGPDNISHVPKLAARVFVTPNASVIGNVSIGDNSSILYGARLLANEAPISIGSLVSIGDKVEVSNVKGGKN